MQEHYSVIIIGGRPAGASLAMRLGQRNIKTLLLDRATFPSLPNVPSSPIFHPGTMRLLDELGIPEADYTHPGGKADQYVLEFLNYFRAAIPVSSAGLDRTYSCGIDRNKFDTMMWERAGTYDSVTTRSGFSVTEILKDGERVIGVKGNTGRNTPTVTITADLVVGADGRFSFTARQVGAKTVEERNENTTASYQAVWENVADHDQHLSQVISMYNNARGFLILVIPIDHRKYIVSTYMRHPLLPEQRFDEAYHAALQAVPDVKARLSKAVQVTEIVGIKEIRNGYREAFGDGWALVGDALHYKDPLDGQGVYDTLISTQYLAESISLWLDGQKSWAEAGQLYRDQVWAATHDIFLQTTARVKQEMYSDPPAVIIKTLLRWLLTNPSYQAHFMRYISRATYPKGWMPLSVILRAILRGIWHDLLPNRKSPVQPQPVARQQ